MLRSAGYFSGFSCPFDGASGAGCPRPHCQYRHGAGRSGQQPLSDAPAMELGKSIQELERIKKAIESVKTEVEEGQKKLSQYNLQDEIPKNSLTSKTNDVKGNKTSSDDDGLCSSLTKDKCLVAPVSKYSSKGCHLVSSKYVIDHSCPATDLEYDPLLNYSAGLLSSSIMKEQENEIQQFKRVKMPLDDFHMESPKMSPCGNRHGSPKKRSRSYSPIKLEIKLQESDDDDILVIDAPPLTVTKKPRISRSFKNWNREENKQENLQNSNVAEDALKSIEEKRAEVTVILQKDDNADVSNPEKSLKTPPKTQSAYLPDVKINALKSLNNLCEQRKLFTVSKENNISSISHIKAQMQKETLKKEDPKSEISVKTSVEELSTNKYKNTPTCKSEAQTSLYFEASSKDKTVLTAQGTCKKLPINIGEIQIIHENGENEVLENALIHPSTPLNLGEKICQDVDLLTKNRSGESNSNMNTTIQESEIIILDSSSEEEMEYSEEDTELSESDDPIEECRRIFNEFVESEAQKQEIAKQALGAHAEVDTLDTKTNMVPGQKKRIAHTAKFDVQTNKEILVPFKAPLPQQSCPTRILQAQQQAVQITAAVKSGQAFVAATSGQKKTVPVLSTTQIQNVGPMVCLNLLEVQPVATSSGQLNVFLQGNAVTAMPCRPSNISIKRIAPMPIKVSSRRRFSIIPESGSKVPHDTRQRYVNFFVEEYLKVCRTVNEAFDKALVEEKAIYDRCGSKNMYLNIAVNTLKKLRDQGSLSPNGQSCGSRWTNTTGSRKSEEKNDFSGIVLYRILKDYVLTEEQLHESGYPQPNPEKPGSAILGNGITKTAVSDASKRLCCRCGEIYTVTASGKHIRKEECNYHSGRVLRQKVPGGLETRYSCCEGVVGSPGCQVAKLHVHDGRKENLDGFVKTFIKLTPADGNHGVFALDCEMCYTTQGLELTRVTVVDSNLQVAYDTLVKPDNEIIDYNTRFSGVTEEDLKNTSSSIRDVQAILLNLFSADTILIGHSLENDLFALKLIHNTVVDTAVVFPHRLGLPHKRALRNLMADYLRRIIQDDVGGHDSSEDAAACMELMLWKVKEDTKGRKW
ncbi:RNA exonuclease 1 homolog isoform X1 [Malaclemys terrapin pileata]|uniref:RNA exonuclease 1 homolog isoform X1 n=1 Tax=Malaclemys terrapin pileata TaxID=2991368 RepID=UPI0023A7ACA5|nr:RNA exonuclease 1 homolog isoform X1 [Malaclemys terrapin pileata]